MTENNARNLARLRQLKMEAKLLEKVIKHLENRCQVLKEEGDLLNEKCILKEQAKLREEMESEREVKIILPDSRFEIPHGVIKTDPDADSQSSSQPGMYIVNNFGSKSVMNVPLENLNLAINEFTKSEDEEEEEDDDDNQKE